MQFIKLCINPDIIKYAYALLVERMMEWETEERRANQTEGGYSLMLH